MKSSPGDPSYENTALVPSQSPVAEKDQRLEATGDLRRERASRDLFVIEFDHNVIIATGGGKVGHRACPVFVVLAGDLSFRWTLDSKRQTSCTDRVTGHILPC